MSYLSFLRHRGLERFLPPGANALHQRHSTVSPPYDQHGLPLLPPTSVHMLALNRPLPLLVLPLHLLLCVMDSELELLRRVPITRAEGTQTEVIRAI